MIYIFPKAPSNCLFQWFDEKESVASYGDWSYESEAH